jgi:hypothetical protein
MTEVERFLMSLFPSPSGYVRVTASDQGVRHVPTSRLQRLAQQAEAAMDETQTVSVSHTLWERRRDGQSLVWAPTVTSSLWVQLATDGLVEVIDELAPPAVVLSSTEGPAHLGWLLDEFVPAGDATLVSDGLVAISEGHYHALPHDVEVPLPGSTIWGGATGLHVPRAVRRRRPLLLAGTQGGRRVLPAVVEYGRLASRPSRERGRGVVVGNPHR